MLEIILLFAPGLLALDVYKRVSSKKDNLSYLFTFGTFVVLINMLSYFILSIYYASSEIDFPTLLKNIGFNYKYLALSLVLGVITAYIYTIAEELIELKITVKKIEVKKK